MVHSSVLILSSLLAPSVGQLPVLPAIEPQERHGPADYADGIFEMYKDLASCRAISNKVCKQTKPSGNPFKTNLLLVYFGQFVDHDSTFTSSGSNISANIPIPIDDTKLPGTEISFTRSLTRPGTPDATKGVASEYDNRNTARLDLNVIYGDSKERELQLRLLNDGKMRTSKFHGHDFLPTSLNRTAPDAPVTSFACGDVRCNQNPMIMSFTTLFVREHNRLCDVFRKKNPHAKVSDEYIFQWARKINVAQYQQIVFEEYLTRILGRSTMNELIPAYSGFKDVSPFVSLAFSTAAHRFGHSSITNIVPQAAFSGILSDRSQRLSETFLQAADFVATGHTMDNLINGARVIEHETIDIQVVDALRNELFGNIGTPLDLAALNCQRGRDMGIGDINKVRANFGMKAFTSFKELTGGDEKLAADLEVLYGEIGRVDAWVGGLSEAPYQDSQLGETFTKIIAEQFQRIRDADPEWYKGQSFGHCELSTMKQVIYRNTWYSLVTLNDAFDGSTVYPQ